MQDGDVLTESGSTIRFAQMRGNLGPDQLFIVGLSFMCTENLHLGLHDLLIPKR